MAEVLERGSASVTTLPPRKAKGAGGTAKPARRPVSEAPPIVAQAAAAAGMGDNLTPEQEAKALRIYHVSKLRAQKQRCDGAKAMLDSERQVLTDLMHIAKADTHIERQEFSALLKAMDMSKTELAEREQRRAVLWGDWELPVGHQMDMFKDMPQEVRDTQWAKGLGYAAGLRGDPCQMPDGMEVRFGPSFGEGWSHGQEELSWALEAVGRRTLAKAKKGGPTREEIERQPEPDGDDPKETLPPSDFE